MRRGEDKLAYLYGIEAAEVIREKLAEIDQLKATVTHLRYEQANLRAELARMQAEAGYAPSGA